MKKDPKRIVETIVREVFPQGIEENLAAALTTLLNRSNIRLSDKSPLGAGPVELTLDASASIVSKLKIKSLEHVDRSTWLGRWVELYNANRQTSEFEASVNEVVRRINEHPWADGFEDDWQ
jgi:hypothetical protein